MVKTKRAIDVGAAVGLGLLGLTLLAARRGDGDGDGNGGVPHAYALSMDLHLGPGARQFGIGVTVENDGTGRGWIGASGNLGGVNMRYEGDGVVELSPGQRHSFVPTQFWQGSGEATYNIIILHLDPETRLWVNDASFTVTQDFGGENGDGDGDVDDGDFPVAIIAEILPSPLREHEYGLQVTLQNAGRVRGWLRVQATLGGIAMTFTETMALMEPEEGHQFQPWGDGVVTDGVVRPYQYVVAAQHHTTEGWVTDGTARGEFNLS